MDVDGESIGPVANVGWGSVGTAPREGDNGVAESSHGVGVLAGVDGFGFASSDNLSQAHCEGVGFVDWDGRVEKKARFEDFELAFLPDMVFVRVVEFRGFEMAKKLQWKNYCLCSPSHLPQYRNKQI